MRIGFIGAGASHVVSRMVWSAAREEIVRAGGRFLLFTSGVFIRQNGPPSPKEPPLSLVDRSSVDALIVYGSAICVNPSVEDVDRLITEIGLPAVSVGYQVTSAPSVTADCVPGLTALVDHLVAEHQAESIAIIGGPYHHQESNARIAVIRRAFADRGVELLDSHIVHGDFSTLSGQHAIADLLDRRKAEVDTIMAINDGSADGAIIELKRRGYRVPDDIRVTGYDDTPWGQVAYPLLTTVRHPVSEMGSQAAHMAIQLARGEDTHSIVLTTRPIIRESCGCTGFRLPQIGPSAQIDAEVVARVATALEEFVTEGCPPELIPRVRVALGLARSAHYDQIPDLTAALDRVTPKLDPTTARTLSHAVAAVTADLSLLRVRAEKLLIEDQALLERRLSDEIDQVMTRDGIEGAVRPRLNELGVSNYCMVEIGLGKDHSLLASSLPEQRRGFGISDAELVAILNQLVKCSTPAEQTVAAPLYFLSSIVGIALLNIRAQNSGAADTLSAAVGGLLHRISLIEEIKKREGARRRWVDRLVNEKQRSWDAERMAGVGRLVTDMAHQFNALLGVATTAVSFLNTRIEAQSESNEDEENDNRGHSDELEAVRLLSRNVRRLAELIDRFVPVTPPGIASGDGAIDLDEAVRTVAEAFAPDLESARIDQTLQLESGVRTHLPLATITSILDALITNSIVHGLSAVPDAELRISTMRLDNGAIELIVADNGHGLSPEEIDLVFDPFYTTRKARGHIGLGLYALNNTVEGFGGMASAASSPGNGFTVRITIPANHVVAI
jgi:DNA-binding LacI/PurR family transcriptional regulator/signal transduction histidine kinase